MTVHSPTRLTPQARQRLTAELAGLLSRRLRDDEADIVDAWLARKARIREIYDLLSDVHAV